MTHRGSSIRPAPSTGPAVSRHWPILALAFVFGLMGALPCAAAPAPPRQEPPAPASAMPAQPAAQDDTLGAVPAKSASRTEAERLYAEGYKQVEKANKEKGTGKAKDAKKSYVKAREKFEAAVKLDGRYFEAWNMIGYSARQAGDLKASFAAYDTCLAINPDYDKAHEYRGEAYIMNGDIEGAKRELAWLRAEGSDEADRLAAAIDKAEGKKPEAPKAGASSSGW